MREYRPNTKSAVTWKFPVRDECEIKNPGVSEFWGNTLPPCNFYEKYNTFDRSSIALITTADPQYGNVPTITLLPLSALDVRRMLEDQPLAEYFFSKYDNGFLIQQHDSKNSSFAILSHSDTSLNFSDSKTGPNSPAAGNIHIHHLLPRRIPR